MQGKVEEGEEGTASPSMGALSRVECGGLSLLS